MKKKETSEPLHNEDLEFIKNKLKLIRPNHSKSKNMDAAIIGFTKSLRNALKLKEHESIADAIKNTSEL